MTKHAPDIALLFALAGAHVFFTVDASAQSSDRSDAGLRQPWTTSRVIGSPDPPLPYAVERAFPHLQFKSPLDITTAPGSDRLFVVEVGGKIFSFPARGDVATADLCFDAKAHIEGVQQVYALAFHPNFAENRYCYICYIMRAEQEDGTHIARFRVSDTDPPVIDPESETTIITFLSGGHNGCCLKFGPDGYLYISTGDGSGPNPPDTRQTGQDISDLLSSILRIDVDHTDGERNYRIPPDNPFVSTEDARPEIWAYGLRNPWRMSFDRKTGDLWVGDVGWELWELLYRIERGGNYGWSVVEGRQPTNPEWPRGPTPILPPTVDHPHSEAASITGGLTYYGSRLPELAGTYIYGDYQTGKIWGLHYRDGAVQDHRELVDTTLQIVGFGEDAHGELYLLDYTGGTINRLIPNPSAGAESTFPQLLSETGLFTSTADLAPAPGVIPYSINAEPWADYAVADRLVALPDDSSIKTDGATWQFPENTVLAKTLSIDTRAGDPASRRRLETQILHHTGTDWRGYTYVWNDEQTDATLLDATGRDATIDVVDANAPNGLRRQTWHYSARSECMRCHNPWSGSALAFNTPQLNMQMDSDRDSDNQLERLARLGVLAPAVPTDARPQLVDPYDQTADLNDRARAYLQANCAHCHRMHAGSAVLSKMRYDLPLEETTMLGVRPTQGTFGIHTAQVISPGDPYRSVLLYRMSKLGGGRMPHIGSLEVDSRGVELIREWIAAMPADVTDQTAENRTAVQLREAETALFTRLTQGETSARDDQAAAVEQMLSSTSGALMLASALADDELPDTVADATLARGTCHEDVCVRDLFERFLPNEQRTRRLGSAIRPDEILSLEANAARGRGVFFNTAGVQCKNCHRIAGEGAELGPDLSQIGKKYTRRQLLDTILAPSAAIDPAYVTYLAETSDGLLHTGLLVSKDGKEVVLRDVQNKLVHIPAERIERLVPQQQSIMPELLLRDMTAQQVADLLAYLDSLK